MPSCGTYYNTLCGDVLCSSSRVCSPSKPLNFFCDYTPTLHDIEYIRQLGVRCFYILLGRWLNLTMKYASRKCSWQVFQDGINCLTWAVGCSCTWQGQVSCKDGSVTICDNSYRHACCDGGKSRLVCSSHWLQLIFRVDSTQATLIFQSCANVYPARSITLEWAQNDVASCLWSVCSYSNMLII